MTDYEVTYPLSAREQMSTLNEDVEHTILAVGLEVLFYDSHVPRPENDPDVQDGEAKFVVRDEEARIEYLILTLARMLERTVTLQAVGNYGPWDDGPFDFTVIDYPEYDPDTAHYERWGRPAFPNEY